MNAQSIASTPSMPAETAIMTVWPTIGATIAGRWVGRLCGVRLGRGFFTLGKLLALATIPASLTVFLWQLLPAVCRRYCLTDRRLVVQKGYKAVEGRSIGLEEFDCIDLAILPGQDWLHAGELVFRHEGREVFRLSGVSRPEVFRQVCLKAQTAMLSFRAVLAEQAAS
ncbi:MAG: PH domain-containing protein [Thermoguttaceae bacterium]